MGPYSWVEGQLDKFGRARVALSLPPSPFPEPLDALVLIEQVHDAGEPPADADWGAEVAGLVESQNLSMDRTAWVSASEVAKGAAEIAVTIYGAAGTRFRAFIGWSRRRLREKWEAVRAEPWCVGCTTVMKASLRAALAVAGIPTPGDIVSGLAEDGTGAVLAALEDGPVARFLESWLGARLADIAVWNNVRDGIDALLKVGAWIGKICRDACGRLGFCG